MVMLDAKNIVPEGRVKKGNESTRQLGYLLRFLSRIIKKLAKFRTEA